MKRTAIGFIVSQVKYSSGIILALLAFCVSVGIHGCSSFSSPLQPLRVGISSWPGFDVILYAQEAGLFEKRGLDVELVRFDSQQDSTRAMMRGSLDVVFSSLWDTMQVDPGNDSPVFVMVANVSKGSDGIVAQPEIKSVNDLVNQKVGAKLGTIEHLILLEALNLHEIDPQKVEIDNIAHRVGTQKLKKKQLAATVTWEPLLSEIAQEINGNIIFTTDEVNSLVINGLVSRQSLIEEKERELKQFLLAWLDLMYAVDTRPQEVFTVVAAQLGQTPEDFARDYAGLQKGDLALNEAMFADNGRLFQAAQAMAKLLEKDSRHGRVIRQDVDVNGTPIKQAIAEWKP
jgi:NitT/TauT family transport system substrate-binding protein